MHDAFPPPLLAPVVPDRRLVPSKADHERRVFLEFAGAAGLPVDSRLVVSRPPPEPDLVCHLRGQPVYFELGRLLDEATQRLKLRTILAGGGAPHPLEPTDPAPGQAVLRKKLGKHYELGGAPAELILYFDNENPIVGNLPPCADDEWERHASQVMLPEFAARPSLFRRTWIFDRHRRKVLWCHHRGDA
jgi:hypothetical protein